MHRTSHRRTDALVFLLGLGSSLYVELNGYIAVSELVAVLLGPLALLRVYRGGGSRTIKLVCSLGLLWLLSAACSDLVNETQLALAIKGLSKVGLIVLQIALAYKLLQSDIERVRWYFVGAAISSVLSIYILKPGYIAGFENAYDVELTKSFEMQWIAVVANFTIAAWFFYGKPYPRETAAAVILVGLSAMIGGSRAAGATLSLAGISYFIVKIASTVKGSSAAQWSTRQVILFTSLLVLSGIVYTGYKIAAFSGLLGDQAKEKYEVQSSARLGLVFGGRTDFIAGVLAIQDQPIMGHGTWAPDVAGYRYQAARIAGVPFVEAEDGSIGRLNGHSNILEAWSENGILAVPFWLYLLYLIAKCFSTAIYSCPTIVGPILYLLYARLWDFFFSPIAARTTLAVAYVLFLLIVLKAEARRVDLTPRTCEKSKRHWISRARHAL
jgi:hypothetical protein